MYNLVYPFFLDCCQYADNVFWGDIFFNLAFGIPPLGTYISQDFLCCSLNQKDFIYGIEEKDSETLYKEVYSLLRNRLGVFSHQDKVGKINDIENLNDIKKKTKETLIELYVSKMRTNYSLSIKQARHLLSTILIAMVFKVITAKDIDYSNGRINKINGINFSKNQVIITQNLWNINLSSASCIFVDKKCMANNWEKYLEKLRKIT